MTNTPLDEERPDPRFAEHLEWELIRAVRREARFSHPVERAPRRVGVLVVALLFAVSLGASSVLAAQELRRSHASNLLAEQYRVRVELAEMHATAAREELDRLEVASSAGTVAAPTLLEARLFAETKAHEAAVWVLDAEEVAATGHEPDRRLSAPLVAGRDFVTLRLDEDVRRLGVRSKLEDEVVKRLALLHESGFTTQGELDRARNRSAKLEDQVAGLLAQRDLRAQFLAGEHDAVRTDLLGLQSDCNVRLAAAKRELAFATTSLGRTRTLAGVGRVTTEEAREAELAVRTAEFQVRLIQAELTTLAARLDAGR